QLIWLSMQTPGYEADRNRIFVYDFTANTKKEVTAGFGYSVEKASWSPDGKKIYFLSGVNATEQLFSYNVGAKTPDQITNEVADFTDFSITTNGKNTVIVASVMSMNMPTEIFSVDDKTGTSKRISKVNEDI